MGRNSKTYKKFISFIVLLAHVTTFGPINAYADSVYYYRHQGTEIISPAEDDSSNSGSKPLIHDVAGNALTFTVGVQQSFTPTVIDLATGATWDDEGATYSLNKSLPGGLSFNTLTGEISGITSSAFDAYGYKISVTSADNQQSSTSEFSIYSVPSQSIAFLDGTTSYTLHPEDKQIISLDVSNAVGPVTYSTESATPGISLSYDDVNRFLTISSTTAGTYTVKIKVTDRAGRSALKTFSFIVSSLTIAMSAQTWTVDSTTQLSAPTVSGLTGTASYYYDGLPDGLTYDQSTGVVSSELMPAIGVYEVSVAVLDSADNSIATDTFKLYVVPLENIAWASTSDTNGTTYVGDTYTFDLSVINSVGSVRSRIYYVSDSSIASYSIDNANHRVAITGLIAGDVVFYASSTDEAGRTTTTKILRLTVNRKDTPVISNVSGNALTFTVGASASFTPKVSNGTTGAAWSEAGTVYSVNQALPPGLSFNTATGGITGTPSATAAVTGYVITVTSDYGKFSSTDPFAIYIVPPQNMSFSDTTTAFSVHSNQAKTISLALSNVVGTATYSTESVTSGLSVLYDNSNQQMSVTAPSAGTYSLKVTAVDEAARSVSKTFTITAAAMVVSMGDQYFTSGTNSSSSAPSVTNALGTVSYSYSDLPPGLTYSTSTGIISGSTTASAGTYTVTLTATDSYDNSTAVDTFIITVVLDSVPGQRYWKLSWNNGGANSKLYEFDLFDKDTGTNWSNKYVAIGRSAGYQWTGANAVDGNTSSYYGIGESPADAWLTIDFGSDASKYPNVNKVFIQLGAYSTATMKSIRVYSSTDGTNWALRFTGPSSVAVTSSTYYSGTLTFQ